MPSNKSAPLECCCDAGIKINIQAPVEICGLITCLPLGVNYVVIIRVIVLHAPSGSCLAHCVQTTSVVEAQPQGILPCGADVSTCRCLLADYADSYMYIVGHCLATKVFIENAGYQRGVVDHRVTKANDERGSWASKKRSTMHLMHPN